MIDFTEIQDGESWELFARDFLTALGFFIESVPDRGPDGGKDLVVVEHLEGRLGRYKFRWLVSCKHYAGSGKAVGVDDESNVLERIKAFGADGFIGFYSSLPSSALNTRLNALREGKEIEDYRVFDSRLIENYLVRVGYSEIMLRFLPESYKCVRPLHRIVEEYLPLSCEICDKDALEHAHGNQYGAIVVFGRRRHVTDDDSTEYVDRVHVVCKRDCDRVLRTRLHAAKLIDGWEDIGDLLIPIFYLRWVFGHMNSIREGRSVFSDQAYEQIKSIMMALAQRVLRETTEAEAQRVGRLVNLPPHV